MAHKLARYIRQHGIPAHVLSDGRIATREQWKDARGFHSETLILKADAGRA